MIQPRRLHELAQVQRRVKLHEFAQASLPSFELADGKLTLLQDLVNTSFQVQQENQRWHLRIYHPDRHLTPVIASELQFLQALTDNGFPAPRPLPTNLGALLWQAPPTLSAEPIRIAVCSWCSGAPIQTEKMPQHFGRVGTLLAKLHTFSANWEPPPAFIRPRGDAAGIYGSLGITGRQVEEAWRQLSPPLSTDLERARDALQQAEAAIGCSRRHFGLVHADPSFGNILFDGEHTSLLDFDDCANGYYVYDLAVVLAGAWGKADFAANCAALLQGYQQVRALSQAEIDALPAAMAARAASLIFWAAHQSPQHTWIDGQWQRLRDYLNASIPGS